MTNARTICLLVSLFAVFASGCATLRNSSSSTANLIANPSHTARGQNPSDNSFAVAAVSASKPYFQFQRLPQIGEIPTFKDRSRDWIDGFAGAPLLEEHSWETASLFANEPPDSSAVGFNLELPDQARLPLVETEAVNLRDRLQEQWAGIRSDYAEFYSPRGLAWLAGGIGAGALMANTGFDEHFARDAFLENIVLAPSDEFYENLHQPKFLGDGYYTIPAFVVAALAEPLIDDLPLGSETAEWGQRSLRTILVGVPPLLGLQFVTGGGRPDETRESSEWRPFQDNNGVSGHAFMGAIPFMSAARMTDNIWAKGGLYAASTLPAISRMNDDAHYFSQVFLGWWLAYLAESAVDRSHDPASNRRFFAYPQLGGIGVGLEYVH